MTDISGARRADSGGLVFPVSARELAAEQDRERVEALETEVGVLKARIEHLELAIMEMGKVYGV